ncbi:uncharacterized protein CIMG_02656 [Coccidioides immitis RS]|uniref:FAD-binding PCMH-type domain-containing protein n=3 Tax=Coccidioides immitis TaxID=5501 RepID=J3KLU5_COCIM|nr:uncharacterized protein CIMG_02656 [Coccidioides immitis RS]EAS37302.3 hypothetical protein CIMG_02656 [Coccidioides immitis RS]
MRSHALSTWFLSSITLVATAMSAQAQSYIPRPLDDMIKDLGLEEHVKDIPGGDNLEGNVTARCIIATEVLRRVLPSEVEMPGSGAYTSNKESYWAQQQSTLSPSCFVAAKSPKSVAKALAISRITQCPFAVRSGGHSDVPGASNTEEGIVIDLRAFNDIKVSEDKKVATVGPGATWAEVYRHLDEYGLTVIGGRASTVGVGGLALGGGMSYISGRGGFACDNVLKFHVMMADGHILEVDEKSHPLLYFALRGGGNNFGIVLRFDFETYPLGEFWGGIRVYPVEAKEAINGGLSSFNDNAWDDPDLAVITSFIHRSGSWYSTVIFDYAKPEANPPILTTNFADLLKYTPSRDTSRITNMTQFAIELGQGTPPGLRQQFTTVTYRNSAEVQNRMVDILMEEVKNIEGRMSAKEAFAPIVAFQPIPPSISSKFSKRGGNALGVSPDDGPLILVNLCFQWSNVADDQLVISTIDRVLEKTNEFARSKGLLHDYIYMNYAAPYQKPVTSYGAENVKKLRKAQEEYDPFLVFERLQPGGFKLDM